MELLFLLVEKRGELVSREEVAGRLWGTNVFVDVDHGINTAVRKVRKALRDDPDQPRFVETVVGKGYRFAAPVTCNGDIVQAAPAGYPATVLPSTRDAVTADTRSHETARGSRKVKLLLMALLAVGLGAAGWWLHHRRVEPARPAIRSLAVLPLKNLSGDPAQDYLADGITEALIARLSGIQNLRVISRNSVMQLKQTQLSIPEIARTLQVDAILEGSVIREGSRILVNAQLVRAATDEYIWAEQYERQYRSILTLESDLSRTIVEQIQISLTPEEQVSLASARVVDSEAHDEYLKGRYYVNQRTEDALNKSIEYYQEAVARDPNYALAYSGLADAYALLGFKGVFPSQEALSRAKAAALKAIELDPTLAEPHASLAFLAETHEWDWTTAEREYRRALELNPGFARAHHWYAGYLLYVGRFDEAIDEAKRARDLDPLSVPVNNALAGRLLAAGRVDEALKQLRVTLEMNPQFAPTHQTLGWAFLNQGKHEQAIREFQQAIRLSGTDDMELTVDLACAYALAGQRVQETTILSRLKKEHDRGRVSSASIAVVYGSLGELNEAFAWLNKAYQEHDPELTYLKVPTRRYQPLRSDPRYGELLHRMGLSN